MKIAVSAASGRLGHAIISELITITEIENIVAIVRDPAKLKIGQIETRVADYQSLEEMDAALQGIDTLIIISAPVAEGGDRLQLHRNVINAAVSAGVGKLIYTSLISNGGEASTLFSDFASINRRTEEYVKGSGLKWIIARNGLYLDLDVVQIRAAADADGLSQNTVMKGAAVISLFPSLLTPTLDWLPMTAAMAKYSILLAPVTPKPNLLRALTKSMV